MTFQGEDKKIEKRGKNDEEEKLRNQSLEKEIMKVEKKGENQNNLSCEGNSKEKNEMGNKGTEKNNGNCQVLCDGGNIRNYSLRKTNGI